MEIRKLDKTKDYGETRDGSHPFRKFCQNELHFNMAEYCIEDLIEAGLPENTATPISAKLDMSPPTTKSDAIWKTAEIEEALEQEENKLPEAVLSTKSFTPEDIGIEKRNWIVSKAGKPYSSVAAGNANLKRKKLDPEKYVVEPYKGGFGIVEKA